MSLEQALERNTAAVLTLATLLESAGLPKITVVDKTTKPAKEAPVAEEKSAPKTDTPAADETKVLTQADVAPIVAAYVQAHGRDAALKVLEPFRKITKLGNAKPEELPGIKAAFKKATAAAGA